MANLPETPQWEEGIYQIEVSDPVLGGPDGISNRQGKQLASRTLYLKQQVEKGGSDLAKHIAAADPHTQYAPKASPTFTGTPTAPTPANSDNSKKLATTEFVAKALAALAGSAPETLDTLKELADALGNDPNFATTVLNKLAEKLAKDQNGADIPDPALFVKNLRIVDATTSQKGLVRLNGGVTNESNEEAATPGAVKIAYDAAMNAFNLAKTKYTADGATTAIAGLVQLVNSMGGSNALVMPQAAVTTAIQTYPSLGKGQTLQDLRGSRGVGVTYTNSTGFPIAVYVRITGSTSANLYAYIDGKEFGGSGATASQTALATAFFIVPNNSNYRVDAAGVSTVLQAWTELK